MTLDPRKRSFPFPALLADEKKGKKSDSNSEDTKHKCKLCNNKSFKNAEEFDFHLIMIHYRDKLSDAIGNPPYTCKHCGFQPTADDPTEEMILHLGFKERFAIKYYVEECQRMPDSHSIKKEQLFHKNTVTCKLCKTLNTNEQLFLIHLTQKHFADVIKQKIPQNSPYKCPVNNCVQIRGGKHELVMHVGIDHNVSMELYQKEVSKIEEPKSDSRKEIKEIDMFKSKPKEIISCKLCKDRKFVSAKSLKYHLVLTHFFEDIMKNGVAKCPKCKVKYQAKNEFASHFIDKHFEAYVRDNEFEKQKRKERRESNSLEHSLKEEMPSSPSSSRDLENKPLPKCREMQTLHGKAKEMKTVHRSSSVHKPSVKNEVKKEAFSPPTPTSSMSSARQRMTDRWKSTSIDSQKYEIEKLREDIEKMQEEHATALKKKTEEFERWISHKEKLIEQEIDKRKEVEANLENVNVDMADLKKQLEQKENKISNLEDVIVEEHNRNIDLTKEKKEIEEKVASQEILGKELCEFQSYIEKMKSETKEVKSQLVVKSEEITELTEQNEKLVTDHEKQMVKLNKQLETLKAKYDKVMEEKKEKLNHIKEITKLHKELENDQKNQINRLTKENVKLKEECESAAKVDSKVKEFEESKLGKKVKALEEEKKESDNTIQLLESQRNALLDSLDRIQKIMQGFESVIKDKNEKIQEVSTKLEESEINLEEALQKISVTKDNDKEKKDSQKLIKQLQASLKDYESRQFTNAKLITGLQREKAILEKKVKDFEDKAAKTIGDDPQSLSNRVKKYERDIKQLRDSKDKAEQELAKKQALLSSKTTELANTNEKLSQAEFKVKELERELRLGPSLPRIPSGDEDNESLQHTVQMLSERYAQLKEDYQKVLKESRSKDGTDTNTLNSTIDALKQVAREAQLKLSKKEKEVERLQALIETRKSDFTPSSSNGVQVKEEPPEVQQIDTEERQIVLDIGDHLLEENNTNSTSSPVPVDPYDFNVDVEGIGNFASPAYTSDNASNGSFSPKAGVKKKGKSKNAALVDVTEQYQDEEDDITCGICLGWDPPLPPPDPEGAEATVKKKKDTYTTSWVGCDCGKWYHKQCTKLKRFTAAFSCKSMKRKCQRVINSTTTSNTDNMII